MPGLHQEKVILLSVYSLYSNGERPSKSKLKYAVI